MKELTDSEFLDDVERRCIHGSVFTLEEMVRLWDMIDFPEWKRAKGHSLYMRGRGLRYVREARRQLTAAVIDRLLGGEEKAVYLEAQPNRTWAAIDKNTNQIISKSFFRSDALLLAHRRGYNLAL